MKNKSKMRKVMKKLYIAKVSIESQIKSLSLPEPLRRDFLIQEHDRLYRISLIHSDCFRWDKPQIDTRRHKRIHELGRRTLAASQCVTYSTDLSKRIEKLRTAAASSEIMIS